MANRASWFLHVEVIRQRHSLGRHTTADTPIANPLRGDCQVAADELEEGAVVAGAELLEQRRADGGAAPCVRRGADVEAREVEEDARRPVYRRRAHEVRHGERLRCALVGAGSVERHSERGREDEERGEQLEPGEHAESAVWVWEMDTRRNLLYILLARPPGCALCDFQALGE